MATLVQAALPLVLFERLHRIRQRYAAALKAAMAGDYSQAQALRTVSRAVGHLLASEARKSVDERGGLRMLDISLMVDGFFPELRCWNQHEMRQLHQRRLSAVGSRAS